MPVPPCFKNIAFKYGHLARIDIDRTGFQALVAYRAMVGNILERPEQLELDRTLTLRNVKQRLDE